MELLRTVARYSSRSGTKMISSLKPRQAKATRLGALLLGAAVLSGVDAPLAGAPTPNLQTYSNAIYGIGFQYPSSYVIHEGKLPRDDIGLGYLGPIPMGFTQPGGVRVVTVELPKGAYPDTGFVNAFFTVSVNQYVTREECGEFGLADPHTYQKISGTTISGIRFVGVSGGPAAMGHAFDGTFYHGFIRGACYELAYGIATAIPPERGARKSPPREVFRLPERIFRSARFGPSGGSGHAALSPSVRLFSVAPLGKPFEPYTYRVSWNVSGGNGNEVFLTTTSFLEESQLTFPHFCPRDFFDVFEVTSEASKASTFGCNVVHPLGATTGSIKLAFRNRVGNEVVQKLRLFVKGSPSVQREVNVTLPTLPYIVGVDGRVWTFLPRAGAPVFAGETALVSGLFLGDETVWVGSTQARVKVRGRREIYFDVPILPPGNYPVRVANRRGRSNAISLSLSTASRPRIVCINGRNALGGSFIPTIRPGEAVQVTGVNFVATNLVWIESTRIVAKASGAGMLRFTAPASLSTGFQRTLYITNKLGRSNEVKVAIKARQ